MKRFLIPPSLRRMLKGLALAGAAVLLLDALAFHGLREGARTGDMGRWTFPDWAARREVMARREQPPTVLFLGDSTVARDLRPALITPEGFNLARTGLMAAELDELTLRLEAKGLRAPKMILLGLLPEHFRPMASDLSFVEDARPGLRELLGAFYREPQQAQLAFLPGTRLLRYRFDAWRKGLEHGNPGVEVLPDGALHFLGPLPASHLHPPMPGFQQASPGYLDARRAAPLRRFVRHWESRGTRLLWVKLPLHPDLSEAYLLRFATDLLALDRLLQELFPGRVIDLSTPLPADHYWDATHLNNQGAERLSRRLQPHLTPHLEALGIPGILGS